MEMDRKYRFSVALCFGIVAGLTLISGCAENKGAPAATAASADDVTAGKAVYASANCANCHALNGQGGRRGPELTHAAAEAGHDAAWFAAFVKDPKSKNPGSRMPSFGGRISDADLAKLGTYLATLK